MRSRSLILLIAGGFATLSLAISEIAHAHGGGGHSDGSHGSSGDHSVGTSHGGGSRRSAGFHGGGFRGRMGDGAVPADTTATVGIGVAGAPWDTDSISLPCLGIATFTTGMGCPTTTRTTHTLNGTGPPVRTKLSARPLALPTKSQPKSPS
jgi:hypothetical protein